MFITKLVMLFNNVIVITKSIDTGQWSDMQLSTKINDYLIN